MTVTPEVRAMLDRESIRNVILRVARAMDRADILLFRSCYHEDAWDDHGYFKGPAANFKPQSIFRPSHIKNIVHNICNVLVDVDGDQAWTEAYFLAYQRAVQDGIERDTTFSGRYIDRFERRNGEWKIARRTTVYDWTRIDVVNQTFTMEGGIEGRASQDDYSYKRDPPLR